MGRKKWQIDARHALTTVGDPSPLAALEREIRLQVVPLLLGPIERAAVLRVDGPALGVGGVDDEAVGPEGLDGVQAALGVPEGPVHVRGGGVHEGQGAAGQRVAAEVDVLVRRAVGRVDLDVHAHRLGVDGGQQRDVPPQLVRVDLVHRPPVVVEVLPQLVPHALQERLVLQDVVGAEHAGDDQVTDRTKRKEKTETSAEGFIREKVIIYSRPGKSKIKMSEHVVVVLVSLQEMLLAIPNHGRAPDRIAIPVGVDHRGVEVLPRVPVPALQLLGDGIAEPVLLRQHEAREPGRQLRHDLVELEDVLDKGRVQAQQRRAENALDRRGADAVLEELREVGKFFPVRRYALCG